MKLFGKPKFRNTKLEHDGVLYDSKLEIRYVQQLEQRLLSGERFTWERQRTLALQVEGRLVTRYRMDFVLHHGGGRIELVETKGFPTPEWKLKWRLLDILKDTTAFRKVNGFLPTDHLLLTLVSSPKVMAWAQKRAGR